MLTVIVALLSLAPQQAFADSVSGLVDFNSPTDLAKFNLTTQSQPVDYLSGGVGGSGAIEVHDQFVQPSATLVYNQRSFSMSSPADSLTLSVMFEYKLITALSNGGGIGASPAGLELLADPAPFNRFAQGLSVEYAETQFSIGGQIFHSISIVSDSDNGTGIGIKYPIAPLTDGHWYRLATTFSFANDSGVERNNFDISLQDYGTTGLSLVGVNFQSSLTAYAQMPVFSDSTSWAGFTTELINHAGAERSDNFAFQTPEPATFGLAALGALLFLLVLPWHSHCSARL